MAKLFAETVGIANEKKIDENKVHFCRCRRRRFDIETFFSLFATNLLILDGILFVNYDENDCH